MDDVVAVEVELSDGGKRYFLTWGRIQASVDGVPVARLVLRHARHFSLGGEPVRARLCLRLREAADSESAPQFYECLMTFARVPIPYADGYDEWRRQRAAAMERGDEIAYCGNPEQIPAGGGYPYVTID